MFLNPWSRLAVRRRVVVNLEGGTAMQGILYRKVGELLVLREAVYLEAGHEPLPIDGEALIDINTVLYTQVIP